MLFGNNCHRVDCGGRIRQSGTACAEYELFRSNAETSVVSALHLKKLPKFFVTLTTRLVDWNGIQSADSVTNIHRRIANEFWSELKIS